MLRTKKPLGNIEDTSITIEHVYPQSLPTDQDWQDPQLKDHPSRLGNLTLLTNEQNNNLSEKAYQNKLQAYKKTDFAITRLIAKHYADEWTVSTIDARQEELATHAAKIWRLDW